MSLPDQPTFVGLITSRPIHEVVEQYIFSGPAYVFRNKPAAEGFLRSHLTSQLPIKEEGIRIVGSAKTGFSLDPDSFPAPFSPASDIDVVVVDQDLFDSIWFTVLEWHYPRKGSHLGEPDRGWMVDRRRAVYWGAIRPNEIRYRGVSFPAVLRPLRDISVRWFNAFQSLSHHPQFVRRRTSGILYRTWEHAFLYHVDCLRRVRDLVQSS